jgi:hypothetical protein
MIEIISDPHFTTLGASSSKWLLMSHKGVVITSELANSTLRLALSGTSGANWHGALRYSPFPVTVGDIFTVCFSARAKHPFTFSVWLGQENAPYKSLVPEENHFGEKTITSHWQTFMHTWRPNLEEKSARLVFVLGQIDNSIEIKGISLVWALAG